MKVSELSGATLDLWVAKAEGVDAILSDPHRNGTVTCITYYSRGEDGRMDGRPYSPSQHWSDGGLIIERELIATVPLSDPNDGKWCAFTPSGKAFQEGAFTGSYIDVSYSDADGVGDTALIAGMRAYLTSKYGAVVPS